MAMNGLPATGASTLGTSLTTDRNRVPSPPARMAALMLCISVQASPFHGVAFEQFSNAVVEAALGDEAGFTQALTRHDIVSFVRILADRGKVQIEIRHETLNLAGQFLFGQVRVFESHVEAATGHALG